MRALTIRLLALACALGCLPASSQVKKVEEISYPRLPEFRVPKPEVYTLSNGMKVFLMEDHELPLIDVQVLVRSGSNQEPAAETGLGQVFGQVQREGGTTSMTGDEMDDFLESRAASIETGVGGDTSSASMNCLAEDFDEVFPLLGGVLRNPAFREDKIELAKTQLSASIARRNDNVGGIVGREFARLIYGPDSPLARLVEYKTVAEISRDDLVAWHTRYYHPNNMYLGIVGDFETSAMKKKIQSVLGSWKRGPAITLPEVPYRQETVPGVYFIAKNDVTQANVRMGHLGMRRDDPDYFAVSVLNEVLGGGFSGRLLQNVRSKQGLAYSVFGGVGASFLRPGIFQAGLSTKLSTTAAAIEAVRRELVGIVENPPSSEEMKQAKESILNSFVFNYTSKSQILGQQMSFAYYGMPENYLEKYRTEIEKVTSADVARVAKEYVHPERMVLLVVGKAAEFDRPLASFGKVTEIDITIPAPPDSRSEVDRSDENRERGRALLSKLARTISNGKSMDVRSVRSTHLTKVNVRGQSTVQEQEVVYLLPDKVRQTIKTPAGEQVLIVNGDRGLVSMGGQSQPAPSWIVEEVLHSIGRQLFVLAAHADDPALEAVASGARVVDGEPCDVVEVTYAGSISRTCVAADGRAIEQTYQGQRAIQGTPGIVTVRFLDYAEFGGWLLPRSMEHILGEEVVNVKLESLELEPTLDPELFEIPAPAEAATAP